MEPLLLRSAVKRGFLIVTANWPIVLIDFAVESLAKVALALPVVGGALLVTAVVGTDIRALLSPGVLETADVVVGSLTNAPVSLIAFLVAVALVAVGSEAMQFVVKAGTLSVIVEADRQAGEIQRLPLRFGTLRQARAFRLELLVKAWRHFARRGLLLASWLGLAVGLFYLALVTRGTPGLASAWSAAWSAFVLGATSAAVVAVAAANLAYTLLRVVIVTDDCSLGTAFRRLAQFALEDARQVIGVFAVIGGIEILAAVMALIAAAALAPIAYLPIVGLLVLPLQAALWLLRALVFESLSLAAVAAYQTQYRRFGVSRRGTPPVA
jgi:hypothetical protein